MDEFPATVQVSEEWKKAHVRQSKYLIQIVKCYNEDCCKRMRTNLTTVLGGRFLPPPILYEFNAAGVTCADVDSKNGHFMDLFKRLALDSVKPLEAPVPLPNDFYCPSISRSIRSYICDRCGLYVVTKEALKSHKRMHTNQPSVTPDMEETVSEVLEVQLL